MSDAHAEHTHKELMRMLSISIKNSKFEKVPSKHAEHAREERMRALSVRVRN